MMISFIYNLRLKIIWTQLYDGTKQYFFVIYKKRKKKYYSTEELKNKVLPKNHNNVYLVS